MIFKLLTKLNIQCSLMTMINISRPTHPQQWVMVKQILLYQQHQLPHLQHPQVWLIRCIARILHNLILKQICCKIAIIIAAILTCRETRQIWRGILKRQIKVSLRFAIELVPSRTVTHLHTKK